MDCFYTFWFGKKKGLAKTLDQLQALFILRWFV